MPKTNPADSRRADEAAFARSFWAGAASGSFFSDLRRTSPVSIQRAILSASIKAITQAPAWQQARRSTAASVEPLETELSAFGLRSGLREVRGTRLGPKVGDLAAEIGAARALALIQAVDTRTRGTISALVRGAAQRYAREPSPTVLRELAAEIRPLIGLTPKQATRARRLRRELLAAGVPAATARKKTEALAESLIRRRSAQIADRAVIESVAAARHRAWLEARDAGEIDDSAQKAWRDQGDGRVRVSHHGQTLQGPIPLDQPYPVFGVLHPPAPEFGCRCWEVLVLLPEIELPVEVLTF